MPLRNISVETDLQKEDTESKPDRIRLLKARFYTIAEVAAMLRVSERTVWNWLRYGKLKAVTFGEGGVVRVRGTAIAEFVKPYRPKSPRPRRIPANARPRIIRRSREPQQ